MSTDASYIVRNAKTIPPVRYRRRRGGKFAFLRFPDIRVSTFLPLLIALVCSDAFLCYDDVQQYNVIARDRRRRHWQFNRSRCRFTIVRRISYVADISFVAVCLNPVKNLPRTTVVFRIYVPTLTCTILLHNIYVRIVRRFRNLVFNWEMASIVGFCVSMHCAGGAVGTLYALLVENEIINWRFPIHLVWTVVEVDVLFYDDVYYCNVLVNIVSNDR